MPQIRNGEVHIIRRTSGNCYW